MSNVKNILLVGVGGQGTILASKILSQGLLENGFDVKMSEVHGMAQRGGSVSTQVRFGEKVYSPLIEKGKADVIVAFEKSEAARWIEYLKKDGHVIVNDYEIYPIVVSMGKEKYDHTIKEKLTKDVDNITFIDAANEAKELGNIKAQNVVLLGAVVETLGLNEIDWNGVIEKLVPAKAVELNKAAFAKGREYIK